MKKKKSDYKKKPTTRADFPPFSVSTMKTECIHNGYDLTYSFILLKINMFLSLTKSTNAYNEKNR
jgi:hypothetical protein